MRWIHIKLDSGLKERLLKKMIIHEKDFTTLTEFCQYILNKESEEGLE
jgi:hypothetical protein